MKAVRILKKAGLYTLLFLLMLTATGYVYLYVLPKGPDVTAPRAINNGKDSFVTYAYAQSKRKRIKVWTFKPEQWQDKDQIVFVMHGGGRNAEDYLDAWSALATQHNLLIIAPEFESKFANISTNDYQEGNLFTFFGTKNPKREWAYTVVENIFDHVKATNNISNEQYDMFGHSAGGQFVHRMVMLMPEARIGTAVAANAGFYTFPEEGLAYPYGLQRTEIHSVAGLKEAYSKRLIILLGALDNDPSLGTFRTTGLAMEQGNHRLARGSNFYKQHAALCTQSGWPFTWEIDTVANTGHNYQKMSVSAVPWLKE